MSWRWALLTVLGLGRLRPAPGTWGSAAAVAPVLLLLAAGAPAPVIDGVVAALAVLFGVACVALGGWAERALGRTDPRVIVADEVAGQSVALLALPWRAAGEPRAWAFNALLAATAFAAFRLLDALKPPPLRAVERVGGGAGILLDDLLAGVAALAVAQAAGRWLWPAVAG